MTTITAVAAKEVYGVSDRWNTWIAIGVKATRTMYKCKKCKHVWAREYRRIFSQMSGYARGDYRAYMPAVSELHRFEGGKVIEQGHDYVCPGCGATNANNMGYVTANNVAGTKTEKTCDGRCTGAKGHNCECSCNGANHGKNHLV